MQNTYNLYNLEASFKKYLLAGIENSRIDTKNEEIHELTRKGLTSISIKNYVSDLRHFFGWLTFTLQAQQNSETNRQNVRVDSRSDSRNFVSSILTSTVISTYKSYLLENNIPHKTINRRLSTIRKFCSFCISQGWIKENPAKRVSNVLLSRATMSERSESKGSRGTRDDLLGQYEQHLIKQNLDKATIASSFNTIQELLNESK